MPGTFERSQSFDLLTRLLALESVGLVLWDFDGVVADTEPLHDLSYQELARRRGWEPEAGYFFAMVGHTEEVIWDRLFDAGLPGNGERAADIDTLTAQRRDVFSRLASRQLGPSWLSTTLMPAFTEQGLTQVVVSNGDPDVIEGLLTQWSLAEHVDVVRRGVGEDKMRLLQERLSSGSLLLEDDARWLALGRSAGAVTVGVRHRYNALSVIEGDFTVDL